MRFQIHMGVSASDIVYSLALTNKKENMKPRMVSLTKGQQYGKRLSHGEVIMWRSDTPRCNFKCAATNKM